MTDLYRHFGEDGTLLYVGVSLSAMQRLMQHRSHAHWFEQIKRIEVERFATRQQAFAAERAAVINEKPAFNIQFQRAEARASSGRVRVGLKLKLTTATSIKKSLRMVSSLQESLKNQQRPGLVSAN